MLPLLTSPTGVTVRSCHSFLPTFTPSAIFATKRYVFSKKQTALERFFCPRFPLDRKHLREELLKDETPTPDK
ncbi:MAG: hypothetical protein LBC02_05150, partial [Planctomycetaceae bacterium]|nr:hypothetical protein [Planctomycetaceae bacterium]